MDTTEYGTPLSKALLTGLFVGIAATLICMIFGVIYRRFTGFEVFEFINFPTLIFGTNSLFVAIGILYFYFRKFFKKANAIYASVFIWVAIICLFGVREIKNADTSALQKGMMSGVIIILSLAALLIPVLYRNKKFLSAFI